MALRLTEGLRYRLKKPLGGFVTDLGSLEGKLLVCVGDQASKDVLSFGLKPKLCVYDGRIKRKAVEIPSEMKGYGVREFKAKNPAGTLTEEVFQAVEKALKSETSCRMLVDGEEDLVALVAIKHAPLGSVVLYGQPDEGLVAVDVDGKIKKKVDDMLSEMEDGC